MLLLIELQHVYGTLIPPNIIIVPHYALPMHLDFINDSYTTYFQLNTHTHTHTHTHPHPHSNVGLKNIRFPSFDIEQSSTFHIAYFRRMCIEPLCKFALGLLLLIQLVFNFVNALCSHHLIALF